MGRSSDFKFWEERLPVGRCGCDDELFEFQMRGDEQVGASSPPLWRRPETSTLLPENHQYSCLSPTSRLRAIADGRKELMEMIKDMPESSYELTLKDIVEPQDKEDKTVAQEEKVKHKRENRIPQRAKSIPTKQICRSESMESEVFLLKMFLPVSLSLKKKKKKAKPRKHSIEGPEKQAIKEWWKIIYLAVKDYQKNTDIITKSNISNITSEKKKYKSRGQKGCLFWTNSQSCKS